MINQAKLIEFIDYVYSFYGEGVGLYAEDYNNGKGVTILEIYQATLKHLKTTKLEFCGDTVDREKVAFILYNQK